MEQEDLTLLPIMRVMLAVVEVEFIHQTTGAASCGTGGAGGTSNQNVGGNGSTNTGGGGGGASSTASGPFVAGGNGGSGIVILRIATANKPASFAAAPGCVSCVSTTGSCTVVKFTGSGTLTL